MPLVNEFSSRRGLVTAAGFEAIDDKEKVVGDWAKLDDDRDKTITRLVVEKYLSKRKWYFPMTGKDKGPKLEKAYAFYEHVTLPRYFSQKETADHVQRRAEQGETEEETRLFSPWTTKAASYIEWGIGVDSYFSCLKIVAFMLLLAGLLNWHNMRFFASSDYSPNQQSGLQAGSAICTTFDWVVCSDCAADDFDANDFQETRFGTAADGTILVLRNGCNNDLLQVGMVNYATFLLLLICLVLMSYYLRAREILSDEDKLTASDYSIVVRNPPPDAYDPDEWRDFFGQFAEKQVTCVTVAINNEVMVRKLIARRVHRNNLRLNLPSGTDMDDEDLVQNKIAELQRERDAEPKGCFHCLISTFVLPIFHTFNLFLPPQVLFDKVVKLTAEIQELQKEQYEVSSVFVTFETEEGQRAALTALCTGELDIIMNNTAHNQGTVFRDRVLKVEEPTEPSAVRWLDLSASFSRRITMRVINLAITLGIVSLAGLAVGVARSNVGPSLSGILVSIFNSIIPLIVKLLMHFERHFTEGSFQTSLYLKITLFRWINTAVLIKLITPFVGTITDDDTDLLPSIIAIFWSELFITPVLKLLDLFGNFKKHFLAPRARNQELMNSFFGGTFYNLGERYTDFSKVLFLVFFYAALFPAGFFFGAAILFVQHYTDKYALMRIWSWRPALGPELAKFSRRYFFFGALLSYALVSAFAWAQFPYDNICDPDTTSGTDFSGTYNDVVLLNGTSLSSVSVEQTTEVTFCRQSWRDFSGFAFPPTSRLQPSGKTWMTSDQETLSNIYGWSSVGVLVAFFVIYFGASGTRLFLSLWYNTYKPEGRNQFVDFSSNQEIFAYVPQVKVSSFPFPLLACDIDDLYQQLIGWNDETRSYDYYNLMFDVPFEGMKRTKMILENTRGKGQIQDHPDYEATTQHKENKPRVGSDGIEVARNSKPIFSIIRHYPPAWLQKELDDEDLIQKDEIEGFGPDDEG